MLLRSRASFSVVWAHRAHQKTVVFYIIAMCSMSQASNVTEKSSQNPIFGTVPYVTASSIPENRDMSYQILAFFACAAGE